MRESPCARTSHADIRIIRAWYALCSRKQLSALSSVFKDMFEIVPSTAMDTADAHDDGELMDVVELTEPKHAIQDTLTVM